MYYSHGSLHKTKFIINRCRLYTVRAILIELQYLNRYLNMVRESKVTICQGMHSNLGDPPSILFFYVFPAQLDKV